MRDSARIRQTWVIAADFACGRAASGIRVTRGKSLSKEDDDVHVGNGLPACSATMYSEYQSAQAASR
jgi:hypothetical protein